MRRRHALAALAAAGSLALAGCTGSRGTAFVEGFEDGGLGGWEPAAAIGPEVDLDEFDWTVGVSGDRASAGDRSLRIWNEGDHDDGTTWVTHGIPVEPGRAHEATVRVDLWSESESFNTLRDAVVRLGPTPPVDEADFPNPGVNTTDLGTTPYGGLREPLWLADGWREYRFEWTSPTLSTDTLALSVGTSVIWEGDAEHYVDAVAVDVGAR